MDEIEHELGKASRKNINPHINSLVDNKFISYKASGGKQYFLIHDPKVPPRHLLSEGEISSDELAEINELLTGIRQDTIEVDDAFPELAQMRANGAEHAWQS